MQSEFHNVILFGAGASFDAGIPLLGSFIDTMWSYAIRAKAGEAKLSVTDVEILKKAQNIRYGLEDYSSRSFFDSRNLEDVLSLLSFQALATSEGIEDYRVMVQAIALTIELSCKYKAPNRIRIEPTNKLDVYQRLWSELLSNRFDGNLPALITFNYDLVLERSLWEHYYIPTGGIVPKRESCCLKYYYGHSDCPIKRTRAMHHSGAPDTNMAFKPAFAFGETIEAEIPYLKLHGSLNWSRTKLNSGERPATEPTIAIDDPLILPPVFNKMNSGHVNDVWAKALEILRRAKHIIIVGYSLPKTDIYMQYFLKSAVGPNRDLQKIIVFDPILFRQGDGAREMRTRYQECFSPQFNSRIDFLPGESNFYNPSRGDLKGTLEYFVHSIRNGAKDLFFAP